jgi:Spy/CpxP family protein refolding chaperone
MNNRLLTALTLVAAAMLAGQRSAGAPMPKGHPPTNVAEDRVKETHGRLVKELGLSGKPAAELHKVLVAYRQDMVAWINKNGPEMTKLRRQIRMAHIGGKVGANKEVLAAVERLRKLQIEQKAKADGLYVRFKSVLTDEQIAQARRIINPPPRTQAGASLHLLQRLTLTKEQKARIDVILKAARIAAADPKTKGNPMQMAWERIVTNVLTEKDRLKLEEVKKASRRRVVRAMLGGVDLTEAQYVKIEAIWDDAGKKVAANPAAKAAIYQRANQDIVEKVLTPEQRKQMKARRPMGHGSAPRGSSGRPTNK